MKASPTSRHRRVVIVAVVVSHVFTPWLAGRSAGQHDDAVA
jgi:hypothetical protein